LFGSSWLLLENLRKPGQAKSRAECLNIFDESARATA
jgi:hypothetical protein